MKPESPIFETLLRWRKSDQEGYRRFVIAFEDLYRKRLDDWILTKIQADLPKLQGAALVYRDLLDLFKEVSAAS